ncbi:MAG: T9SS type A sorting domain-containing protein [Ignavibacteria bacterium]|nr:T9SS type A sorting domain-containing protein [Ignavibacteria bacterium]
MKNLLQLFTYLIILTSTAFSQWIPVDSIRVQDTSGVPLLLNQSITTRGVVTTFREFGGVLVYFQSRTAGLVGYDTAICNRVKRGDSIEVTGVVTQYSGLTELTPVTSVTILDTGKIVTPVIATTTQIKNNGEVYEGMLVKIVNVTAVHNFSGADVTTWSVSGSGTNYRLIAGNDSCDIRIYATTNIANQPIHAFPFNLTAECSQFKFSAPFFGGYQLLPRSLDDFTGVTGVINVSNAVPDVYSLHQNYPNPFNPVTKIKFEILSNISGQTSYVKLIVFDALGKEVKTLLNEKLSAGSYEAEFNGSRLSSGVYFYRLEAGNFVETKKMILLQ